MNAEEDEALLTEYARWAAENQGQDRDTSPKAYLRIREGDANRARIAEAISRIDHLGIISIDPERVTAKAAIRAMQEVYNILVGDRPTITDSTFSGEKRTITL